jgi:hypothetical protein
MLVGVVVLVVLSPAVYSYTATMVQPSSLPLGVRSRQSSAAAGPLELEVDVQPALFAGAIGEDLLVA